MLSRKIELIMPKTEVPTLGTVVFSKAGRDKKRYFVIVGIKDENFILIADGNLRKMDNPKLKKLKHIEIKDIVIPVIKEKLVNSEKVYDYEIREHLKALGYNI